MNSYANHFGLVIAYLLPGFIGLAGVAPLIPLVATWLAPATYAEASLGPPLYATLLATTVGMVASCFRWATIDQAHRWTGVRPPRWDDAKLERNLAAFTYLVESHYRHYQFVSNGMLALIFAYAVNRALGTTALLGPATDAAMVVACAVLYAASRDALSKYYRRTAKLLGDRE